MQRSKQEKLNVVATFASFKQQGIHRKITPWRFVRPNGQHHTVDKVRRTYMERVGGTTYLHFVLHTTDDRYFDIVFDNQKMCWRLVLELEDGSTLLEE
jgi:hypothetical protein